MTNEQTTQQKQAKDVGVYEDDPWIDAAERRGRLAALEEVTAKLKAMHQTAIALGHPLRFRMGLWDAVNAVGEMLEAMDEEGGAA